VQVRRSGPWARVSGGGFKFKGKFKFKWGERTIGRRGLFGVAQKMGG